MIADGSDEARRVGARARPLGPFLCEAAFRIAESLYIGPENDIAPADDLLEAQAEMERGDFASDDEVSAVFSKCRAL
ncbi:MULTISPECIES: hypothetical protein [Methylorubrum]|jgi:hypothetical protein|uniref:Uncharacterized protein n=2 Tax=Methylorubrum extorquens TaxID=408 RepID=C5AT86_METEA|nr:MULTISPECIES: hypothetical protein [Methylorubrum]ACS38396.1 Hypothetical protein MexAM1_META1p0453 [Methylorubrum extorquens AM1]EHP91418.1 hypothetical protein MetexDRAFT_3677 [Methylorubrum extorquens DSM 13060]MCP1543545.1 hypothetical protein [Methylorubrum extorquens]MCP1589110.1 hypothetical protein [Methylorubrum extorquens]BDL37933.1 hypothetical protein MSPGM_05230 [Methylorubrum sp. GM97]